MPFVLLQPFGSKLALHNRTAQPLVWEDCHRGALRLQIMVSGVLDNPARIINSYQVCSSWVHILDAVPWPGTSPSQNAIPDPTLGGKFPDGQRRNYPTARTLW